MWHMIFSSETFSLNAFVVMDLVRIYQEKLHVSVPWNVMQCNVAHDIFFRDFEFECICRDGFNKNIPRKSTREGPLECDAVYCET